MAQASKDFRKISFRVLASMAAFMAAAVLFISSSFAGDVIKMKNKTLTPEVPSLSISSSTQTGAVAPRFIPTINRVYYIIQFDGAVLPEWKASLKKAGIELGSYLPDDAFLAKIQTPEQWVAVNNMEHLKSVTDFKTDLRISQDFSTLSVFTRDNNTKALVKLAFDSELPNFLKISQLRRLPFVMKKISDTVIAIETKRVNIEKLADIEGVEWIEPFKEIQAYDVDEPLVTADMQLAEATPGDYTDLTGYESGTKLMNFDAAYARGFHGEGEVVGIADTGLDRGSLDTILDDFKSQVLKGYALGPFSKSWEDPQGHGTHTAGSIVSTGAYSHGLLHGGAYAAKLVEQGLWSPLLNNISIMPDFEKLFGTVRSNDGVHVHSDSWGSPRDPGSYDNFAYMVDEVAFNHPDLLMIFAAGNDGADMNGDGHIDPGSVSTPGTAKNCLTVGASKNYVLAGGIQKPMKELREGDKKWGAEPIASSKLSDNPNGIAAFSSIGPTQDGRIKPEIVAPGTNIVSARSQQSEASTLWGAYNQYYAWAGGTSMATPLTAGAAVITRQYLKSLGFGDPSAALVKAALIHTATDLFPGQFGEGAQQEFATRRPNMNEGYGRVNMDAATNLGSAKVFDETVGLKTKQFKVQTISLKPGQPLRATMSYTDAPASAGSAQTLVNNLDMTVVAPSGKIFYPNHGSNTDWKNNTEMIEVNAEEAGTYKVVVRAQNVPKGRPGTDAQPYALIIQ